MKSYDPFDFPRPIGLGVATAPTQIEGFETRNSWYDWAKIPGKIADGSTPSVADRHWTDFRENIELMDQMGIRYYRLGLEWSRIEPEEGHFDKSALDRYREELKLLSERGIRPLVTLHHFSNPSWFERRGAFLSDGATEVFLRYVRYIVSEISDLCDEYITINEPNVYAVNGYLYGIWPPGEKSLSKALRVMNRLAICHLQAVLAIREIYKDRPVQIGYANHFRIFHSSSGRTGLQARLIRYLFQDGLTRFMTTGRPSFPFGTFSGMKPGTYCDFVGVNYYTRSKMKGFRELPVPASKPRNDLGWEIYPDGIRLLANKYHDLYGLPVWITENGTADRDDRFRSEYLYDHLREIALHCPSVERYYHWTFIDNFEWAEGETARFGLVANHFQTQERTIRKSGQFYSGIIRNNGASAELISEYIIPWTNKQNI